MTTWTSNLYGLISSIGAPCAVSFLTDAFFKDLSVLHDGDDSRKLTTKAVVKIDSENYFHGTNSKNSARKTTEC